MLTIFHLTSNLTVEELECDKFTIWTIWFSLQHVILINSDIYNSNLVTAWTGGRWTAEVVALRANAVFGAC